MEFAKMQLTGAGGGDLTASAVVTVPSIFQYSNSMDDGRAPVRGRKKLKPMKKEPKIVSTSGKPSWTQYHWYLFEQPDYPEDARDGSDHGESTTSSTTGTGSDTGNDSAQYRNSQKKFRSAKSTTGTTTSKPATGTVDYYNGYNSDNYYSYFPSNFPNSYSMNYYDPSGWGWSEGDQDNKGSLIAKLGKLGLIGKFGKLFGAVGLLLPLCCFMLLLPLLFLPLIPLGLFAITGIPIPVIEVPEPMDMDSPTFPVLMPMQSSTPSPIGMQTPSPMGMQTPPPMGMQTPPPMGMQTPSPMGMPTPSPPMGTQTPMSTHISSSTSTSTMSNTGNLPGQGGAPPQAPKISSETTASSTSKQFSKAPTQFIQYPPPLQKVEPYLNGNILPPQLNSNFPFIFLNETYEDMHSRKKGKSKV